ncbi:NXPE family member 3-like [Bombina bombina]|uniref:NXPE family member 3-like n=1 Tax=Bombina bombina TaxID=8345 RepID=UPI00235ADA9D|nr:NXPE family member 3-like [Bombina bombina]
MTTPVASSNRSDVLTMVEEWEKNMQGQLTTYFQDLRGELDVILALLYLNPKKLAATRRVSNEKILNPNAADSILNKPPPALTEPTSTTDLRLWRVYLSKDPLQELPGSPDNMGHFVITGHTKLLEESSRAVMIKPPDSSARLVVLEQLKLVIYTLPWQKLFIIVNQHPSTTSIPSSITSQSLSTIDHGDEELQILLKRIEWPLPPIQRSFEFSTNPKACAYVLLNPHPTYTIEQKLEIRIIAKDHKGRPKTYGGDFFQAKLHSTKLKAGVSGSITDHNNGTYTASFLLLWPGETMVSVRLIHSSEAISILHQKRDKRPDKIYYNGYFEKNGTRETVECNFDLPGRNVCKYYDATTGETWVCERPKKLPCDAYNEHSSGGKRDILTREEQAFLAISLTDQQIPSQIQTLNVSNAQTNDKKVLCTPGLKNPNPSGFYYQDVWISRTCSKQNFIHPSDVAACLSGKLLYMFGDSTLRQWWDYLVDFVPSLKQIDLHVHHQPGPLLATDAEHNYLVQWRVHQRPLRMERLWIQEMHYIASELDQLGNRKGMVIVLNCWAHFLSFPVEIYVRRLRGIRDAVSRLLNRSPDTKILIKSANTGYGFSHGSDWLSLQLDTVMRAMFSKLPVIILDVWEMTSCHRDPEDIHPRKTIIKNEVDLMLSFICPK